MNNAGLDVPDFGKGSLVPSTYELSDSVKAHINGIYTETDGSGMFGNKVVVKWNGNTMSIFTGIDYIYFVMKGGFLDSVLIFEGYWRNNLNTDIGLARIAININEGGRELIEENPNITKTVIRGTFSHGESLPLNPITLKLDKVLKPDEQKLSIIAHRGGGRTSDLLPASENSLGIIRLAPQFGVNGIEIDVRLTKDGVPILYHDENFTSRLINSDYIIGPVSNYSYKQIRTFCTLKDRSLVPTLREALNTVLYETKINLVWLDTKSGAVVDTLIQMQKEYKTKANAANRNLEILIGIPDEDILNAFVKHPEHLNAPALCELSVDDVERSGAIVWAPRWTLGTLNTDVIKNSK